MDGTHGGTKWVVNNPRETRESTAVREANLRSEVERLQGHGATPVDWSLCHKGFKPSVRLMECSYVSSSDHADELPRVLREAAARLRATARQMELIADGKVGIDTVGHQ